MNESATALAGLGIFFALILLVFIAIGLAIAILYILCLRKAVARCAPQNRVTTPDSAWLLLIPFFNLVWNFLYYPKLAETLDREFRSRNMPFDLASFKNLGLALSITQACCLVPLLNMLAGIASLICLILVWIKVSGFSSQLAAPAPMAAAAVPAPPQF